MDTHSKVCHVKILESVQKLIKNPSPELDGQLFYMRQDPRRPEHTAQNVRAKLASACEQTAYLVRAAGR
jgi:hypothetical protein